MWGNFLHFSASTQNDWATHCTQAHAVHTDDAGWSYMQKKKKTKANGCRLLGSERSTANARNFATWRSRGPPPFDENVNFGYFKIYINVLCAMATTIDTWMRCISQHISRIKWMIFPLLLLLLLLLGRLWRKVLKNTHFERISHSMACHEQFNGQQQPSEFYCTRSTCITRTATPWTKAGRAQWKWQSSAKPLFRKIVFSIKFTVVGVCMRV